ncbi:phosphate/phosphite/phosphonate ABC transporter substrate-binding protein [Glutamicibacter sp. X7]
MKPQKILTGMLLALSALSLAACSPASEATPQGQGNNDGLCPAEGLSFGVEPYENPTKLEPAYRTLAEALSQKLNCPVEVQIVEDYAAEVLAMRNGKLDLGQFGPMGYVFADGKAGAEPLVSFGTADGKLSTYTGGIWVPKDSPIRSVEDLRGKDLALGSVGSTSGDVLPRYALAKAGIAENELNVNYAGGHPEALLALTNGTVDAAEINSQTLETATSEGSFTVEDYRQIWTSEPIPNDPITVAPDMDPKLKDAISQALLNLEPETIQEVANFLDVKPAGNLQKVTKETYAPLFDLAKTMKLTEDDI